MSGANPQRVLSLTLVGGARGLVVGSVRLGAVLGHHGQVVLVLLLPVKRFPRRHRARLTVDAELVVVQAVRLDRVADLRETLREFEYQQAQYTMILTFLNNKNDIKMLYECLTLVEGKPGKPVKQ